jgi:hypothetical protein
MSSKNTPDPEAADLESSDLLPLEDPLWESLVEEGYCHSNSESIRTDYEILTDKLEQFQIELVPLLDKLRSKARKPKKRKGRPTVQLESIRMELKGLEQRVAGIWHPENKGIDPSCLIGILGRRDLFLQILGQAKEQRKIAECILPTLQAFEEKRIRVKEMIEDCMRLL